MSSDDPIVFFTTLKSRKALIATQNLRLPIWDAIFFVCITHVRLKIT